MLVGARLVTTYILAATVTAELSEEDEEGICPMGESCQRAALLQARTDVRMHGRRSVMQAGSNVREEIGYTVGARMAERQRHMMSLNQTHLAYATRLRRTITALNQSMRYSTDEVDTILSEFIEDQSASDDKCPALLLEAKHQLNDLHAQIIDLTSEVQVTDQELHSLELRLEDIRQLIDGVIGNCREEEQKCNRKLEDDKKMWLQLKKELIQMQQIAGAQVTVDISQQGALSSTTSTSAIASISSTSGSVSSTGDAGTSSSTTSSSSSTTSSSTTGAYGSSSTTSSSTTGAYGSTRAQSGQSGYYPHAAGLVQISELEKTKTLGAEGTRKLVSKTKQLATDLVQCMANSERKAQSLLQAAPGEYPANIYGAAPAGAHASGGMPGYQLPSGPVAVSYGQGGTLSYQAPANQASVPYGAYSAAPGGVPGYPVPGAPVYPAPGAPGSLGSPYGSGQVPGYPPPGVPVGVSYGQGGTSGYLAPGQMGYHPATATPTQAPPDCAATLEVDAHVGDATKVVGSGRPLHEGEHATVECGDVNPEYKGVVWLLCTNGRLSAVTTHCFEKGGNASQCEAYKKSLEATYVKAYVNLVRTIAEYEAIVVGTDCRKSVYDTCLAQNKGNYKKLEEITEKMSNLQQVLLDFKTRFQSAKRAEAKLQKQVKQLTERCHTMEETSSCLGKVRDAIHMLGLCPGMGRPEFKIPIWTGKWITAEVGCGSMQDDQVDQLLNSLCAQQVQDGVAARAAECSEIEERTVEGVAPTNTARVPLIGTCPNCEGDSDADTGLRTVSGHARKCWDPQADLSVSAERVNCQSGMKAVLCVVDRGHISNYFDETR